MNTLPTNLCQRLGVGLLVLSVLSCVETAKDNTGPTGSFSISAPALLTVEAGSSGAIPLTVARSGGFSQTVTLTLEDHPSGISHDTPLASIGAGTVALSFSVAATVAPGAYSIRACGTATGVTARCATITLTVTPRPVGFFTLGLDPASLSIDQGQSATVAITLTRSGHFTGPVWLDIATWETPQGVTFAFDPEVIPAGASSSTLTITVAANAPPMVYTGTSDLWVAGMGSKDCGWQCNGLRHDVQLLLTVVAHSGTP